jgi:DNA-binding NtrC family response regulator
MSPVANPPVLDGGTFHESVRRYKRELVAATIAGCHGNRTHAARALGLQRTYLLRLIRDLEVDVPASPRGWRPPASRPAP